MTREQCNFATYEQAMKIVKQMGIKTRTEYFKRYTESDVRIPRNPHFVYESEWKSWSDFLSKTSNKKTVARKASQRILSYDEAKKFIYQYAIDNNIRFSTPFDFYGKFVKTKRFINDLSQFIPVNTYAYYVNHGEWKNWEDFLSLHTFDKMTFSEMQKLFKENNVSNMDTLIEFCEAHPEYNISNDIEASCKMRGDWKGWGVLFGLKCEEENKEEINTNEDKPSSDNDCKKVDDIVKMLEDAIAEIKRLG